MSAADEAIRMTKIQWCEAHEVEVTWQNGRQHIGCSINGVVTNWERPVAPLAQQGEPK